MNNFYNKTYKLVDNGVLLFKLLFLFIGFLQASSLTFGHPIISVVQWPTVALGCLLILYRVLFFGKYMHTRGIWLLIIFAAGYVASTLYTWKYGYYTNIRYLIFMVMQIALLYAFDCKRSPRLTKRDFTACAYLFIILTAVLSIISFVFMIIGYSKIFSPAPGEIGPVFYHGFVHGRLFGAYWDPNIAATMTALSALFSLYFIFKKKNVIFRVILALNVVLQIAYMTFSDSRTGQISLFGGLAIFTFFALIKSRFIRNTVLKSIATCVVTIVVALTSFVVPKTIKNTYNTVMHNIAIQQQQEILEQEMQKNPEIPPEEIEIEDIVTDENTIDRGYDTTEDISNRRFDIWKAAIDVFKSSPIIGVSRANILAFVEANIPDSYLITNDHMRFDSMHNMFFEILASQGLVGIVSFVLFAAWVVLGIIKNFKKLWESKQYLLFVMILSLAACVCVSTLVMAEIVYVTSPLSTMFWLGIGCINHFIAYEDELKVK